MFRIIFLGLWASTSLVYGSSSATSLTRNNQNWTSFDHDEITANLNLIQIDVSDNNITEFNSSTFSNHRFLDTLILSRNFEYVFPPNVSFLLSNSLERFECVSCAITTIYKETFSELPKLKEVDLSKNHLSLIGNGAFDKSFFIRNLNFDLNLLKKIPVGLLNRSAVNCRLSMNNNTEFDFQAKEVWLKSKTLTEFQCNNCGITAIYEETFSELPNLEKIYLNDNQVSAVNSKMFLKNRNITALFIDNNNLSDFPMNVIDVIVNLTTLCIDGNPLTSNAINAMKNYYVKVNLRTNCTEKESAKYFENQIPIENKDITFSKMIGISDAFIASYLLIIFVAEAGVTIALIVYWFKIVLTDKMDEFDYSSNVLSNHDIYDVS